MKTINWAGRVTNEDVLTQIGETRFILNTVKQRQWDLMEFVLRHDEKSHYYRSSNERTKTTRNTKKLVHISTEKTQELILTLEGQEKWSTRLNVVNQLITS